MRFRPGTTLPQMAALHSSHGARIEKAHGRSGLQRLSFGAGANIDAVLAAYARHPRVESAARSYIARAYDAPNDTNYAFQWHMHNTAGGMWAEAAWPLTSAGAGVTVAVIDSGAAYEDYDGPGPIGPVAYRRAPDLSSTTFVSPWDFYNNDAHANDDNGHGTHVTGTIAQDTDDNYGVAGVAHNATIMPIKVLTWDGTGNDDDLVEALYYAVDNGAHVISMSLGFTGTGGADANGDVCTEVAGLNAALDYAEAAGVVVAAAAGNDGGIVTCPAAYAPVLAVGAGRFDGTAPAYSNRGAPLDVSAPGGDTTVDQNGDGWSDGVLQETYCYDYFSLLIIGAYDAFCDIFFQGTSMATPHVAGVAALLLGIDPSLSAAGVRQHITSSARDRGAAGWDPIYGHGALDAHAAVLSLTGGGPTPTPTNTPAPTNTLAPTNTPVPTNTSVPTATLSPTNTPPPTNTAVPTNTSPPPTATATATSTSTATATPSPTPTATATSAPPPALHAGDLDGAASGKSSWTAKVTVYVHDSAHRPISGATVTGAWGAGASGGASCVTDRKGKCTVQSARLPSSATTATFTVTGIAASGYAYNSASNHDPDGSSNGTLIVVTH